LDTSAKVQLEKDLIAAENNARATLAQIIGGAVLLFGLYFTWKTVKIGNENLKVGQDNLRITEEGKLTERFSKAVDPNEKLHPSCRAETFGSHRKRVALTALACHRISSDGVGGQPPKKKIARALKIPVPIICRNPLKSVEHPGSCEIPGRVHCSQGRSRSKT